MMNHLKKICVPAFIVSGDSIVCDPLSPAGCPTVVFSSAQRTGVTDIFWIFLFTRNREWNIPLTTVFRWIPLPQLLCWGAV